MSDRKVRVRFAPSPTGPLHIGGVRTALFNYLFAKRNGGDFILRIEDTDQTRYVEGAEQYIVEGLEWSGMEIAEGPNRGGEYGPYRQSDRKPIYKEYVDKLIASGDAYYAFDSSADLDAARSECEAKGETFIYSSSTRSGMSNSLSMEKSEWQELIDKEVPYVVRFCMPVGEEVTECDLIRGDVTFKTDLLDDKVLFKSDGMPTYHLANVVDDHLMDISHVIRGEEWLPSLPLHILLYEKFGWRESMPKFAHLPLILKPVGKGKLSKRDGDKLGFPVFPLEWTNPETNETARGYREDGYLPDAFINMLALLGWNPGTEQEIFTKDELCSLFSLDRVAKSGARFDPDKNRWFNHQYIAAMSDSDLADIFRPTLVEKGLEIADDKLLKIVGSVKERVNFLPEIWDQSYFFFVDPTEYDAKVIKKHWKGDIPEAMVEIANLLESLSEWEAVKIKDNFSPLVNEKGWPFGKVMNSLRASLVGGGFGPDLFEIMEIIGQESTVRRVRRAVEVIGD